MKRQRILFPVRMLVLATLLSGIAVAQDGEPQSPAAPAEALGTGFTYQGQLVENGSPVNDECNMDFRLYDEATGGAQVGSAITATVSVTDGLFTVTLDFGAGAFDGDRRWLGIGVDCEEDGIYADLGRQELTAAPYALYAASAPWSGLAGVPAGFADGVDDDTTYTAGDGLVLDGTEFSAQGSSYANVVVVAKSDGDYSSVQAAIDGITDATADNPYLVWVAPGVYSETVAMKPHVHLRGAGQGATVISSTASSASLPPTQATLVLTHSIGLRDLTVSNGGTGSYNVALLATAGTTQTLVADVTVQAQGSGARYYAVFVTGSGTSVTMQDVTALAEGGSNNNYGLSNGDGASAALHGGSFTGRGGIWAHGIYNYASGTALEAWGIAVLGEDSSENGGLVNDDGAEATLHGGSFTGRGGSQARGIYNYGISTTLEATGVTALGEGCTVYGIGLYNYDGALATLHGGSFTGLGGNEAYGIYSDGISTTLKATGVTALGEGGASHNYGLHSRDGASAALHGGSFTARGGNETRGIYNYNTGSTLNATSVTALAEDGSNTNYGLYNHNYASAVLRGGSFTGLGGSTAYGIYNHGDGTTLEASSAVTLGAGGTFSRAVYLQGGTVWLGVTEVDGGAAKSGGTMYCWNVYSGSFNPYTCP